MVEPYPSAKYESQLGWWTSQYMEQNVQNHQPEIQFYDDYDSDDYDDYDSSQYMENKTCSKPPTSKVPSTPAAPAARATVQRFSRSSHRTEFSGQSGIIKALEKSISGEPSLDNHRKTIGKWWLNGFYGIYPLVTHITIEHGHRNSGFTHEKLGDFPELWKHQIVCNLVFLMAI